MGQCAMRFEFIDVIKLGTKKNSTTAVEASELLSANNITFELMNLNCLEKKRRKCPCFVLAHKQLHNIEFNNIDFHINSAFDKLAKWRNNFSRIYARFWNINTQRCSRL